MREPNTNMEFDSGPDESVKSAVIWTICIIVALLCVAFAASGCSLLPSPQQTTNPVAEANAKALDELTIDVGEFAKSVEARDIALDQKITSVVNNVNSLVQHTESTQTNVFDLSPRQSLIVQGVSAGVGSFIIGLCLLLLFVDSPPVNPIYKSVGLAVGLLMMFVGPVYAIVGVFINPSILPG